MKKLLRNLMVLVLLALPLTLLSCGTEPVALQDGDPYTVTFVDQNGEVLSTIDCIKGEVCDIVAPTIPSTYHVAGTPYFTRWSVFESDYANIESDTTIYPIYTLSNVAFSLFGRDVVFYSLFIMTGILVALMLGLKEAKRTGIKQDDLIDGFLWIVPVAILGARLWYVAFEPSMFFYGSFGSSILRVLGFQTGTLDFSNFGLSGLAIHGAFITAAVCAYFYTKKRNIDVLKVLDIVAIGFIIAQAFGRWGNFFNQEAHGGLVGGYLTMSPYVANLTIEEQYNFLANTLHLPLFIVNNMYISSGLHGAATEPLTGFYHPTFFYESMLNLVGFSVMLVLRRIKKVRFGELMSVYLIWYGSVRIFIETMRTDPLTFELFGITFKSAIVTSVIMILLGIALSLWIRLVKKGDSYETVPGYFGYVKADLPSPEEETNE